MEFQPRSWRSNFEAVLAGAVKFKQAAGLFYVGLLTLFAVNSALFHRKWIPREYHARRRLLEEKNSIFRRFIVLAREKWKMSVRCRSWKRWPPSVKEIREQTCIIRQTLCNSDAVDGKLRTKKNVEHIFSHEFVRSLFISHKHNSVLPLQIENPVKVCSATKIIPEVVHSAIHPVPSANPNSRSPLRTNVRIGSLYLNWAGNSIGVFIRDKVGRCHASAWNVKEQQYVLSRFSPRLAPVPFSRWFPPPPFVSLLLASRCLLQKATNSRRKKLVTRRTRHG